MKGVGGIGVIAVLLVVLALLLTPTSARGVFTIGSDLAPAPTNVLGCGACTWVNSTLPGQRIVSPTYGVVVRWRARIASSAGGSIRLEVIRSTAFSVYTGISMSPTQVLTASGVDTTFEFPTRQPIVPGDLVALDADATGVGNLKIQAPSGPGSGITQLRWMPSLAVGQVRAPNGVVNDGDEILINADIELDIDCDGFGDETQDSLISGGCGPIKPATLLNKKAKSDGKVVTLLLSCAVQGGDCNNQVELRGAGQAAAAAAAEGTARLGSAAFTISAGASGMVAVPLNKRARKFLREDGKLSATATVNGGTASTTAGLTIKRKHGRRKKR